VITENDRKTTDELKHRLLTHNGARIRSITVL